MIRALTPSPSAAVEPVQVVWFKRDLRVEDHVPLVEAAARGPVVCLYVVEPEALARDDFDPIHLGFVLEALEALDRALRERGARLTVRVGRIPEVFEALWRERPFATLHSHEETGVRWTFARDRRVARWARERGVAWREVPQGAVLRGGRPDATFAGRWHARMDASVVPAPARLRAAVGYAAGGVPAARDLDVPPERVRDRQRGGEALARGLLAAFLARRADRYAGGVSSPLLAATAGSRLSPHLAYGTISARTVHHAVEAERARARVEAEAGVRSPWGLALATFAQRLRWRCRLVQELEASPRLEFEAAAPSERVPAERPFDDERFAAWAEGRTGYPLVDACMRLVRDTGWVNFRMRAMLASFGTRELGLPWRAVGLHLARAFLDYEPGIHWPQVQRSAGAAGPDLLAAYDPVSEARRHDPDGRFVRSQLPALAAVPDALVPTPWRMTGDQQRAAGCVLGAAYPAPIVPPTRRRSPSPGRRGRAPVAPRPSA